VRKITKNIKLNNQQNKEYLNIQLASLSDEPSYSDRKKALFMIHDFDFNLNGLRITEELCSSINPDTNKPWYDSLNNAPIVAATNGIDLKGHEPEIVDGAIIALNTDSIGTLYDTHIGTHEINGEEKYGLWSSGILWLRFQTTLNVIQKIYDTYGSVDTSVEVKTGGYEFSEEGRTATNGLLYIGHCLLGVSKSGAYPDSGMYEFNLEVAEAIKKDIEINNDSDINNTESLNNNKGGINVNQIEFNFGKEIKICFEINAEQSLDDIRDAVWSALHPTDADGNVSYKYWICELFQAYAIIEENDTNKCFKMNYSINSEGVANIDFESKIEVVQVWQETNQNVVVVNENTEELDNLKTEISNLQSQITEKETTISELNTQIETLTTEIATKNEALEMSSTTSNEKIIKLGEVVEQLKTEIASLSPIKDEYEKVQAEIAEQELIKNRANLKQYALNSKLISEQETVENEDIKNAIFEVNTAKIKEIIADRIVTNAQLEINSINNDVVVNISEQGNLIPETMLTKYGIE